MGFMRGRVDIKGQCGCAWSHIEPGVTPEDEAAIYDKVRSEVIEHAQRVAHSPTIVVMREHFYSPDYEATDPVEDFERAFAEPG